MLFLVIRAVNRMQRKVDTEPAKPAETPADVQLLIEIRDLLRDRPIAPR